MADLRRAEKLASAKKRLKQFQQKTRDGQSESGRSTPSKKKSEDEELCKAFQYENGGSNYSENVSSNISGTDSPVLAADNRMDSLCQIFNGNSQPDVISTSNVFSDTFPKEGCLFQTPSPRSFFTESPQPANTQSGSDFFDTLSSGNELPPESSQICDSQRDENLSSVVFNQGLYRPALIDASTPDGPGISSQDTPNYTFPEVSVSPIVQENKTSSTEAVVNDLEMKLKNSLDRNAELDQQLNEQKLQILQLQSHLEDMKKKADESVATLKHHIHAIEILVSEKTELQNMLDRQQEDVFRKAGEVEELQGRLKASRHRVSELERELNSSKSQVQLLEGSVRELTSQQAETVDQSDSLRKQVGNLELTVSDLKSKLESKDEAVNAVKAALDERTSQLSLAQVRIQQLSGGQGNNGVLEEDLQKNNEALTKTVSNLQSQLNAVREANEESVKEYQRYVNRLHTELQELKAVHENSSEQVIKLVSREQQLVQQVSELERQLNRTPQAVEDPALRTVREELRLATDTNQALQAQMDQKSSELECLRGGLQERALRIQELEVTLEQLRAEQPNTVNLQAAIESDKVAASRAVAQNNTLKKQLEELQEALVKLSNNKLELTQQLQYEQHLSRDLSEKLEQVQGSKHSAVDESLPQLRESETQTAHSQPVVSPEAMAKLEEKFRKTMSELADLSDEKQRLEHLVLQLQSETETIGEYITLYQIQRGMLRQRAQEKDEQVAKLAQDKEALRNKLSQLNCLVQKLVDGGHQHQLNGHGREHEVATGMQEVGSPEELNLPVDKDLNIDTAQQIRSLLTEIGTNNLVTSPAESNINFHPCPWCSGRLITI